MFADPIYQTAHRAAEEAGAILRRLFRQEIAVSQKASYNLVTEADVQAEQAIVDAIQNAFPDHVILGEESSESGGEAKYNSSEHLWIVDPLDGTNNFVHGVEHFAVSIAYYFRGQAEVGVVYQPMTNDFFVAKRGTGAFRNREPAKVSTCSELDESLLGIGFYYDRGAQMRATLAAMEQLYSQQIHGFRRMGTAALDLCMVGCGQLDGYFEFQLSPWDFAAGALFAQEAGGRVSDCQGKELPVGVSSIVASNSKIHEHVLRYVQPKYEDYLQESPVPNPNER